MHAAASDLSGQSILITGASRGLGAQISRVLARAGASVALTGRDVAALEQVAKQIRGSGGTAACFPHDLADADGLPALVDAAEAELGPLDILVNNAGISVSGRVIDASAADFDRIMTANVKAAFLLTLELGRRWIERGEGGRIINIASMSGEHPVPGLVLYGMSKASLIMLTRGLAREWARHGINVNAILPGYMKTDMNREWFESEGGREAVGGFRRRRLMQLEDIDGAVLLLASPASRAITGASLLIDDAQLP
jgi:NAD(P)-dependent dehydrogenase (short-subunit alcohol dehydrogenase family)